MKLKVTINNSRMYAFFLTCITIVLSFMHMELLFAMSCIDIKGDLPTTAELTSPVETCIKARKWGNPNSITEFVCPQGEFFSANNQPITDETLAYTIATQVSINKVDRDIMKYMKELKKSREPDPTKWTEAIDVCQGHIKSIYDNICKFGVIESRLNAWEKEYIKNTSVYPQTLCSDLTNKKINAWRYLQYIIMSDGISKNQKNSTDKWITEVKWAYGRVLWSWHNYQKILARAVSKMTGYTEKSN